MSKVDELIDILHGKEPPSEEERKQSLLIEGKELSRRLTEYELEDPKAKVTSGMYAGHSMAIHPSKFYIIGRSYSTGDPTIAVITLADMEKVIMNARGRLSKIEGEINKALQKFPSETLEGKMEGKDNKRILDDMAYNKMREIESYFSFLAFSPDRIRFEDHCAVGSFKFHIHVSSFVSINMERINGTKSQVRNDIQFLLEFEQIKQHLVDVAEDIKVGIRRWVRRYIGDVDENR